MDKSKVARFLLAHGVIMNTA